MHSPLTPFFFFNDTATTEIYTLSLHDALPIYAAHVVEGHRAEGRPKVLLRVISATTRVELHDKEEPVGDRKSTRLNSSHLVISYAVFCLKKKKNTQVSRASLSRVFRVNSVCTG